MENPATNDLEVLKYGKYYNVFFSAGLAALLICGGLVLYIGAKKFQKYNPVGIMFNILLI